MSVRDSFSQAIRDRLKKDSLVGSDLNGQAEAESGFNRYLQEDAPPAQGAAPSYDHTAAAPPEQQRTSPFAFPEGENEEITTISRNTVIDGNIRSFASVNVEGNIKGNVELTKTLQVSGKIVGDVTCSNGIFRGSAMQGELRSKGQVYIDRDAMVLGDVSAQYAEIDGKIKGNIEIGGKAEFREDAVIFGDISASTITVADGATIQGYITTTFLREENAKIFPEAIVLGE